MSFRTFIVTAADAPLARDIAALTEGGSGMFVTGLSKTGSAPATHYVSTGVVSDAFAAACPEQVWEQQNGAWVLVASSPGDPGAVYAMCQSRGLSVTLADIDGLFARSDVTQEEPFTAFERLGLGMVQA